MQTAIRTSWPTPPPPAAPRPAAPSPPPPSSEPAARRRWPVRGRRLAAAAAAAIIIAASLAFDREPLAAVAILFVLVVPFEKLFPRHRQPIRRPLLGTDLAHALVSPLMTVVGVAVAVVVGALSLAWLPGLALRPLVSMVPPPLMPFLGVALFDLAIYWTHRWYHEVPFLWRFHSIHHSTEHLDWISGLRSHPFDGTLIAPPFFFLVAAGFSPEFTGALAVVQVVLGIFLHANVRFRLRWLHKLVITPEFHHWHHANEPVAIHSNYSVFLPAWDLLFGTYFMPDDRRPTVYGVNEPIPDTLVGQLWHPLRGMGNPLRIVRHPIRSTRALFRFVRQLLRDIRRSTTRRRNVVPTVSFAVAAEPPIPAPPVAAASGWVPDPTWPAPTVEQLIAPARPAMWGPTATRPMPPPIATRPMPRPAPPGRRGLADLMGWDDDGR